MTDTLNTRPIRVSKWLIQAVINDLVCRMAEEGKVNLNTLEVDPIPSALPVPGPDERIVLVPPQFTEEKVRAYIAKAHLDEKARTRAIRRHKVKEIEEMEFDYGKARARRMFILQGRDGTERSEVDCRRYEYFRDLLSSSVPLSDSSSSSASTSSSSSSSASVPPPVREVD